MALPRQSLPLGDNLPGWVFAGLLATVFLILRRFSSSHSKFSQFPLLGKELGGRRQRVEAYVTRPRELYAEGYRRFREQIYRLTTTDGDHLVIPFRYLDELRRRPDDEVDVHESNNDAFSNEYIDLFPPRDRMEIANSVIKGELTRNLAKNIPRLSAEVETTVRNELPECKDWTPLQINAVAMRIVAIVSGNFLVGPENCRHPVYLDAAVNFTRDASLTTDQIKRFPRWLRPLVIPLGLAPSVKGMRAHRHRMAGLLGPIVQERRQLVREGNPVPEDVLQWMLEKLDAASPNGEAPIDQLVQNQLVLTQAAIHTTTIAITALTYDLAVRPEIIEDIRKEIVTVLQATDGVITSQTLFDLKLLDSFMRECQRFTPPFVNSFQRYVAKPITLKDGTRIPAGTFIEAPGMSILHDAEHYADPDCFDPYRFYRLRTEEDTRDPNEFKSRESYQYVSVTKENTAFGYGRHACPGRFFAANEIKLIMARILMDFDIRLPPGVQERYPNTYGDAAIVYVNEEGLVEFRRREK